MIKVPRCHSFLRNLQAAAIFYAKQPYPPSRSFNHSINYSPALTNIFEKSTHFPKRFNIIFISSSSQVELDFNEACKETLESICDYFEEIVESIPEFRHGDVTYSDGVLTAHLGNDFGTYVINRQSPNRQIWLSSPTSGPKRYDLVNGVWVYKHDNRTLHSLLDQEIQLLTKAPIEFSLRCHLGKKE